MSRSTQHLKDDSFNFRIDPVLKAAFVAATEADDQPAAQVLRNFMRVYVKQKEHQAFETEARRQSLAIAARANDSESEEYRIMQEIEAELGDNSFGDEWKV